MLLCWSSGGLGEVVLVALGEVAVVVFASFECGDSGGCCVGGAGCVGEGEAVVGALSAQVGAVGGWGRVGEQSVDLACDVAFEAAGDLAAVLPWACRRRV